MSNPGVYLFFQGVLGAIRARRIAMSEYVHYSYGQHILDIGCGPGYVSKYFKGVNYIGFDTEKQYISYANNKYGHQGKFFCQEFDAAAVDQFEPFDVIIMNGLLHHLPDSAVEELLKQVRLALKPEGVLVTLDCYCAEDQSFLIKKMLEADRGKFIRGKKDYIDLVSNEFGSVIPHIRNDLMFIPYPLIIMQIS